MFIGAAAAAGVLAPVLGRTGHAAPVKGGKAVSAPAPPTNVNLTPTQALQLLKDGNTQFMSRGPRPVPDQTDRERRLESARGQNPFAAYLSCSDSRVPPELLFGRGLGELFIIRNAGNTVDTVAMGSIEYAVAELGVPLVVVMGHQRCGAVKAAVAVVQKNKSFPGSIGQMIEPIVPAVLLARSQRGDLAENAARANVRRMTERLRDAAEPMLLDPQKQGKLMVVGAYYHLDSGKVDFFDEPDAAKG